MSSARLLAILAISLILALPLNAEDSSASAAERLERLEQAVQQLQQRNAELEKEVRSLKQKATAGSTSHARPTPPAPHDEPSPSTNEKNVVAEDNLIERLQRTVFAAAGASEFKLTLGGFIQAQFDAGDVSAFEGRFGSGVSELKDRFRLRRARLYITGAYEDDFDFKIEGEYQQTDASGTARLPNFTRTGVGALDVYINWSTFPEVNVKAGQYKAPFGLEQITSDPKLYTLERSLVTTALTPERQVGVQFWGKPFATIWPEQKERLTYFAGIFNGTGRNIVGNDNNEFMYVGRGEVLALQTELGRHELTLKIGGNGLWSRDDGGTTISSVLFLNPDGSLSSFAPASAAERTAYGADLALRFGQFDLAAEYISERVRSRHVAGAEPQFSSFRADGYYIQGSYFVIPKKLQLLAKWESFNPGQLAHDDIISVTAGINYYIRGDDLKLMAAYIHTWSELRQHSSVFDDAEFDQFLARLQLMF